MYREARPLALVYKGPAADPGCPEDLAKLLRESPCEFRTMFVAKEEDERHGIHKVTAELLSEAVLYAQPGGPNGDIYPGYGKAFREELRPYKELIRDFVLKDGRCYLGSCFGAYAASSRPGSEDNFPGFGLLPDGVDTGSEVEQDSVHVFCNKPRCGKKDCRHDGLVQIDWTRWDKSRTVYSWETRWAFFQDGACVLPKKGEAVLPKEVDVLAKYHATKNVAVIVCPAGNGVVGISGPHLEANRTWYEEPSAYPGFTNPSGYSTELGFEFVEAIMSKWNQMQGLLKRRGVGHSWVAQPAERPTYSY